MVAMEKQSKMAVVHMDTLWSAPVESMPVTSMNFPWEQL